MKLRITFFQPQAVGSFSNYGTLLLFLLVCFAAQSQYVSPNQPGRKGGDTGAAIGNQVVTSTYYGTDGSLLGQGTLLAADKNPPAGIFNKNGKVLHFFKGFSADAGFSWYTTPFTASDGNIYGNSFFGGSGNVGAVYKYNVANAAAGSCSNNESVIYNMGGSGGSYGNYANLNELSDGLLYLPETAGGPSVFGKLTKMTKSGGSPATLHDFSWTLGGVQTSIYSAGAKLQPGFATWGATGAYDGAYPYGFPVEGPDGYVYGTTVWGGLGGSLVGWGTVYKVKKDGTDYKILAYGSNLGIGTYNTADGGTVANTMPFAIPWGNVAFDQAGEYAYFFGGYQANGVTNTYGDVCRVKIDGSAPVEIVHKFKWDGVSTTQPYFLYRGPLIVNNELFGTTYFGGSGAFGTVWKLDLSKLNPTDNPIDNNGVNNTVQTLHNFTFTDGAYPFGGLIYDGEYLYGSTQQGGFTGTSYGTVYKLKTDGTGFQSILDLKNQTNACPPGTPTNQQVYFAYYPGNERVTLANLDNNTCYTCIQNQCNAGSTAPTLSVTTKSNVCPATTVDLTSITSSNAPSGTTLTWHTGTPATAANKVATPTAVAAGTYYAAFFDATNNCYSTAATSVTATVTACTSCNAGTAAPILQKN